MKFNTPDCAHCKSRKDSLFHYCHLSEVEAIDAAKSCATYKRGQIIFNEGSNPLGLYCVNEGKIKLYRYASDGKEQIVRIAKAGDFLGYSTLLSEKKYPVTAAALEDCIVCLIPKQALMEVFKKNERFSDSMIKMLSSNLDDSFGKMADLAYKPVRGRMAEALLFLNAFYKDEKNKNGIITMTREDLASFVGTVKETAIRILKEFKDEGLIETDKSDIIIKNTDGLIRISKLYD
jgi:CRP-like cAMP-binding protein